MAKIRRDRDGELHIDWAPGEFEQCIERWRNKPETKAMFAKLEQERKERVRQIVAQIDAQKKK
ncbi:hypothetical protein HDR66_00080 [bacterium]|nr:hypothetical protein [bacterium]